MSWLLISNNSVLLDEHSIFDQHLLLRLAEIWSLNLFFLCTFCKIKSPRFFCCCWFWVSTLLLYLKKLIILPNIITPCSLWTFFAEFLPVKIFHQPTSLFSQFPLPPHSTCWWCPRHLTLCQQRELDSSYDLLRVFPLCLLILSSFRVKVRFYLRKTN